MRALSYLCACLLLVEGCAMTGNVAVQESRLDILHDRRIVLRNGSDLAVDEKQVRDAYQAYLDHSGSTRWRTESRKRVADMEVEGVITPQAGGDDYQAAINTYRDLLKNTPDRRVREPVLYALARAYAQQGEAEQQQKTMAQLLEEYPDSPYRIELEFRMAEYLFGKRDYRRAGRLYEAVLSHQEMTSFQEKARYKLAWSLYREHRYDDAITRFLEMFQYRITPKVVENGTPIESLPLTEADRQLMQDVVRGFALTASADDNVNLKQRFASYGEAPYAYLAYSALIERYVDQARYHDAAETAREYVKRWPAHPAAPRLQLRLLAVIEMGGFVARLEEERVDFVNRYHPGGNYWRIMGNEQRELLQRPLQLTMVGLAQRSHGKAQRTKNSDDYRQAIHWYRRFLEGFPQHSDAPRISYLLGDALYENSQYDEAAAAYEKSAYHYPGHEKGADAGYAALQAYRKHEQRLEAGEFRNNWHWLGISSALSFINRFPDDSRTTKLLASTAEELYAMHRYQRSSDVARLLLARKPQPEPELVRTAWTILGYSEFELGRFEEAEQAYREVLAMTGAKDPQRPQRIEWLAAAIYKQAEAARDQGNHVSAAAHFLRVGELVPDTKIRVTADYDAATSMIVAKRWDEAIALLSRFRNNYRNSPLQNSVSEKLAVAHMRAGHNHEAAVEFEEIAAKRAEAKDKREAVSLAAELYEKSKDHASQQRLLKRYIKEYPSPLEPAMEARYKLAMVAQARGDYAARDQLYKEMIQANAQLRSEETLRTRYLASYAQLQLARIQFEAFNQIRLTSSLTQNLQHKTGLMEATLNLYEKVLDYGSAETITEATWHIAEVQRLFGKALMESERPKNLTSEELEQYELMLEERAFPFEENAIKIHATNVGRIRQGIYDEWIKRSMASLVELNPARYAKYEMDEEPFREMH